MATSGWAASGWSSSSLPARREAGAALIERLIATAEGLNGGDLADDVALLVVAGTMSAVAQVLAP